MFISKNLACIKVIFNEMSRMIDYASVILHANYFSVHYLHFTLIALNIQLGNFSFSYVKVMVFSLTMDLIFCAVF